MEPSHTGVPAHDRRRCPEIKRILARVGDRWSLPVVNTLTDGPHRFNTIKRAVPGISQRMLTLTLRSLERDGLVTRTVYPTVPPRVDYELTPLGRSLRDTLAGFGRWADDHLDDIEEARRRYDRAGRAGQAGQAGKVS